MARALHQPKIKAADGTCRRDTPDSIAGFAASQTGLVYDQPYFNFRTRAALRSRNRTPYPATPKRCWWDALTQPVAGPA